MNDTKILQRMKSQVDRAIGLYDKRGNYARRASQAVKLLKSTLQQRADRYGEEVDLSSIRFPRSKIQFKELIEDELFPLYGEIYGELYSNKKQDKRVKNRQRNKRQKVLKSIKGDNWLEGANTLLRNKHPFTEEQVDIIIEKMNEGGRFVINSINSDDETSLKTFRLGEKVDWFKSAIISETDPYMLNRIDKGDIYTDSGALVKKSYKDKMSSVQITPLKRVLEGVDLSGGRSRAPGFFPYLNNTSIDLEEYQIYPTNNDNEDVSCLLHTLKMSGVGEDELQIIANVLGDGLYVSEKNLKKVCEFLQKSITLTREMSEGCVEKSKKRVICKNLGKNGDIAMGQIEKHLFINNTTKYTKFYVNNCEEIDAYTTSEDRFSFNERYKEGFRSKKPVYINSFNLILNMKSAGYFNTYRGCVKPSQQYKEKAHLLNIEGDQRFDYMKDDENLEDFEKEQFEDYFSYSDKRRIHYHEWVRTKQRGRPEIDYDKNILTNAIEPFEYKNPNDREIVLLEKVDRYKLGVIIKHFDYFGIERGWVDQEYVNAKAVKTMLQSYFAMLNEDGETLMTYYQNDAYGRYWRSANASIQSMPREVRQTITADNQIDIDISNCHPSVLLSYCNIHDIPCEHIKFYVDNRDACLNDLMGLSNDDLEITKADAKCIMLSIMNGGKRSQGGEFKWFRNFVEQMLSIQARIVALNPGMENLAIRNHKRYKKKYDNIKGSCVNYVLIDYENRCLMCIYDTLKSYGIEVSALVFDGLQVYRETIIVKDLNVILKECSKNIFTHLKMDVKITVKPMEDVYVIPEEFMDISIDEICEGEVSERHKVNKKGTFIKELIIYSSGYGKRCKQF